MPVEYKDDGGNVGDDILSSAVDIGNLGGDGSGGAPEPNRKPGKRIGRPPGSKNTGGGKSAGAGKEKARHSLDLSSLTGLFVGIHVIAAGATGVPECAIDMDEGKQFMSAAQNVMRHYSVESSQKTIDWLAFGGTCCMIYGTRFGAYMLRKREEQRDQKKPGAVLYSMPPRSPAPQQAAPSPEPPSHVTVEMEFESE
jgi:hypothetical protein